MGFPKIVDRFDKKPYSPRRQSILAKVIFRTRYLVFFFFLSLVLQKLS